MKLPQDQSKIVEQMSNVDEESLRVLSERGLLNSLTSSSIKKLQAAWMRRVREKTLAPETLPVLTSYLLPANATQEQIDSASAAQIDGLLGVPWNDQKHSNQVMNVGVEELNKQAPSKSQHRGQWSVLGAYAMAELRRTGLNSGYGVPNWEIAPMIKSDFIKHQGWQYADVYSDEYRGCLAPAIAVQWRPGITMSAPILLSELGKKTHDVLKNPQPSKSLDALSKACGIQDTDKWISDNANGMAEFTHAILRPNARTQYNVFSMVWSRIMESSHASIIAKSISGKNAVNLLLAITGNFMSTGIMSTGVWNDNAGSAARPPVQRFKRISRGLFPSMGMADGSGVDAYKRLIQTGEHDTELAQAIVIDVLATSGPQQALEIITAAAPTLTKKSPVLKIIKLWMASRKKLPEFDAPVSAARATILGQMASKVRDESKTSKNLENKPKM